MWKWPDQLAGGSLTASSAIVSIHLNPPQSISKHPNPSECISMHQSLHISPLTASHCPQHPNRLARPPGRDWGGRFPLPSLLLPNLPLSLHHTSRVHSTTSDQSIPTLSELPSLSHFLNFSPTTSQMKLPMGAHLNHFFFNSFRHSDNFGKIITSSKFWKMAASIL